jgi:membrane-associated phospholipid phosphatase
MRPQPAEPLLADPIRPWTACLLACCTVVAVVLGLLFAHQSRVDGLDNAIDSWVIRSTGGHTSLLLWLAAPATLVPAGLTSLIMIVACLLTGRLKGAVLAATAVPTASALCDSLIKPLVHRSDLAYPSGHVTSILALSAMLTVLLVLPPQPLIQRQARLLIPVAAGVIACGVAFAVIGLRWHFFTDTIGGAAVGTGTVCGLALILDLPAVSRWLQAPADWLLSRAPASRGRLSRRPANGQR